MIEFVLVIISIVWFSFASIQDLKTREVSDWLSYSLIIIGLIFYLFKSIIFKDIIFILQSLVISLSLFLAGSLMYYLRQWGGGDVKLLAALGALFPLYPEELLRYFNPNLDLPFALILVLNIIIFGSLQSLIYNFYLVKKNNFKVDFKLNKIYLLISLFLILITFFLDDFLMKILLLIMSLMIFIYPNFKSLIFSIENKLMIKKIPIDKLTEGDWVIKDIYYKNKLLYNKNNPGISISQIKLLKKFKIKDVIIKEGMPFIPSFLIALIVSLIFGNLLKI
jgi:hypothetical protein